jgi:RecA-family ATPase
MQNATDPSILTAEIPLARLLADDLLTADLPARGTILAPVLRERSLNLLYARRGLGKTFVALAIARAAAAGERFLAWQAERQHRVVYVDGQMAAVDLRHRLPAARADGQPSPA